MAESETIDPRKPAAIETTNVPQVPDGLWQQLARYQEIRHASFAGWSPRGDGMLVATRFGNTTQLHRVYQPGGRREQITFSLEPVAGGFIPKSNPPTILFSRSRGGNEDYQVNTLEIDSRRELLLSDGSSRNSAGAISPDAKQLLIHSNRRNGRDMDIYLARIDEPNSMEPLLETNGEYWYSVDWSPDGTKVLLIHYVSANESYLGVLDLESKSLQRVLLPGQAAPGDESTDSTKQVSVGPAQFSADGASLLVATDMAGEFRQLASYYPENQEIAWLSRDIPWNVESLIVDRDHGVTIFSVNADGASNVYMITGDGEKRKLELPLGIVEDLDISPDGTQLGLTLIRADRPADAYSYELATGKLTQWTFSESGGIPLDQFIEPTQIEFTSFDDRKIPGYYYRPHAASQESPVGVVVLIHGGPESQYRPRFSSVSQMLASELGLAVVAPNVRGSAGYGKTYLKLDNGPLREDSVKDIGALLDWITSRGELDEERVLVYGGSYGGYMVLASLSHYPDQIKAGIDIVGIANFITFLERTKAYRRDLRRAEYGDERDPQMRAVFEQINPTARAGLIRSPLLVVHGKNDPRVPFFEAQQIAEQVKSQQVPVWTVYADNEGHGFAKKDNADYLRAVMMMFVDEFLGDSATSKSP